MASNTKQAIKEAQQRRKTLLCNYIDMWRALFHNSVTLSDNMDVPKRYLLKLLLENGAVAYDKELRLYLPFTAGGVDIYGLPEYYTLIGYNGFTVMRRPDQVVILRANDVSYAIINFFEQQAEKIVNIDTAISQNLESIRTMSMLEVPDQSTLLTLANLNQARQIGATVAFVNKQLNLRDALKTIPTGAQLLLAELQEGRKEILNETLATIGISSANTDKRERVQSMEVNASQGYAKDMLNTLVDTFNYDAEYGGIPDRLTANTTLFADIGENLNDESFSSL